MIVVDKLCYRSRLRYINADEKFAFSMLNLLFCVISRSILIAVIVFVVNGFLTVGKGKIPYRQYAKLLAIPFAFLMISTLTIIVNISKTPLDAYAIPLGDFFVTGSQQSFFFGIQLIMTAMASVSCLYFLSLNTTMTDILGVLARLHCPELLIELMMLIYRFIFVLMETASAILISQRSRLGNIRFKTSIDSFGKMGAGLLLRAFKRSNILFDAMESRCYDGKINVLEEHHPAKKRELIAILVFECILLGLFIWRKCL